MAAQKESALGKYKGDLFIREVGDSTWIDVGAVRALIASIDGTEITEIKSDNRGTLVKFVDLRANITLTLLETFDRDKLSLLYNTSSSNVAGTPVAITNEALGSGLAAGTIKKFAHKNGANTQVASISLADAGGAMTLNTDYALGVDSDGYTYVVILVATTGATVANYTYTPNQAEQAVVNIGSNELKNFEVKIEAITDDSKNRTITLSSAVINASYSLSFADILEAGDLAGAELVFDGNRGSTLTYYDEILS